MKKWTVKQRMKFRQTIARKRANAPVVQRNPAEARIWPELCDLLWSRLTVSEKIELLSQRVRSGADSKAK